MIIFPIKLLQIINYYLLETFIKLVEKFMNFFLYLKS